MYAFRLRAAAVALAAGVSLSACTTPYGYNGVSVGLGNAGYYDPYYGGYGYGGYPAYGAGYGYGAGYPGYGYGYAPYYGWYDNFYYPGSGYYVYDIYRNPYRWTDAQRRYWESRRDRAMSSAEFRRQMEAQAQNWSSFEAGPTATTTQQVRTRDGRRVRVERSRPVRTERATTTERVERSPNRAESTRSVRTERVRPTRAERSSERTERQTVRAERRSETRSSQERSERSARGRGGEQ